jgi:cytochrome b involved in lipid metabolism
MISSTLDPKYSTHGTVDFPSAKVLQHAVEEVKLREKYLASKQAPNPQSADSPPPLTTEEASNSSKQQPNPQMPVIKPGTDEDSFYSKATLTKRNPLFHYIHGKPYDLRRFMATHPGGSDILLMSQGIVDATPMFESYHAMANRPSIMSQLEKYRVVDSDEDEIKHAHDNGMYSFKDDGVHTNVLLVCVFWPGVFLREQVLHRAAVRVCAFGRELLHSVGVHRHARRLAFCHCPAQPLD